MTIKIRYRKWFFREAFHVVTPKTRMSVLLIVRPKCTLAASHAAHWWFTVSMPMAQTDRRTEGRTPHGPLRYIMFSARRGQRKIIMPSDPILCKVAQVFIANLRPKSQIKTGHGSCSDRFNTLSMKHGTRTRIVYISGGDAQYVVGIQQLDTSNVREYWTIQFSRLDVLLRRRIFCKATVNTYMMMLYQRLMFSRGCCFVRFTNDNGKCGRVGDQWQGFELSYLQTVKTVHAVFTPGSFFLLT